MGLIHIYEVIIYLFFDLYTQSQFQSISFINFESVKSRAWRACMLLCSARLCGYVVVCLRTHVLKVLTCFCVTCLCAYAFLFLACSRACMFTCLSSLIFLCPYVLICLVFLLSSNILCAYVLTCFLNIVCPTLFTKNPYIENSFLFRSVQNALEHL